jgi:hypothetical protein
MDSLSPVSPALALASSAVRPDPTMGLSFADTIATLAAKKIEEWVWMIPKGTHIPAGFASTSGILIIPHLHASKIMSVLDMTRD